MTAAASNPRDHVHAVVEASGTSFLIGMRALPAERREAMYAIYAFCREVDDVADEPAPFAEKEERLAQWRAEIEALYRGEPHWPTARALAGPVARYNLPKAEFLAVIEGMEWDAERAMVAPSWEELLAYCRRAAGAVGMLSVRVFGAEEAERDDLAIALGEALQLTNILRDLAEDAERGRCYLPAEALEAAAIESRDPRVILTHPNLDRACLVVAEVAEARFEKSRALMRAMNRRPLRPAILMMAIYRRILEKLRAAGWRDPQRRVSLSKAEKAWAVIRHGLLG